GQPTGNVVSGAGRSLGDQGLGGSIAGAIRNLYGIQAAGGYSAPGALPFEENILGNLAALAGARNPELAPGTTAGAGLGFGETPYQPQDPAARAQAIAAFFNAGTGPIPVTEAQRQRLLGPYGYGAPVAQPIAQQLSALQLYGD